MTDERLLRLREVARQTGYSGTTIYRLIRGGRFPAQVKLAGGGASAWRASEVSAWIAAQGQKPAA